MTTQRRLPGHPEDVVRVELLELAPAPTPSAYDWPQSPALELLALRVKLDAACRKGEARQGWIPCRVVRKALGLSAWGIPA